MMWLGQIIRALFGCWVLLVVVVAGLWLWPTPAIVNPEIPKEITTLPKSAFTQSEEAYQAIGPPFLTLNYSPPSLELPDLRTQLAYFGKNVRPDVKGEKQRLQIGFQTPGGPPELKSVTAGEKFFLLYEKKDPKRPGHYLFSPENEPAPLWIEIEPEGEEAIVTVGLMGADGNLIGVPSENRTFPVKERELPRIGSGSWKIDGFRVDGSLLARQRGRWFGSDLFINHYGGEEYQERTTKQRLQFGVKDNVYTRYVGENDFLIWKEGHWEVPVEGSKTQGFPLLLLRKIDERLLRFDLWDGEGKARVTVNMIKSTEMWRFPKGTNIRFAGARTRSQAILEFDEQRIIVGPHEWLLRTEQGWGKLTTIEQIDDYVEGRIIGELFVCEGVVKEEGQQLFRGRVYSPMRSIFYMVDLGSQSDQIDVYAPRNEGDKKPPEPVEEEDEWESFGKRSRSKGIEQRSDKEGV